MAAAEDRDVRGEVRDDDETYALIDNPDSTEDIPTLDFGPYREGRSGGLEEVAAKLGDISRTVGFFYLKNHGIPQSLIDRVFAEARRFYALPESERRKIGWRDEPLAKIGYQPHASQSGYETSNVNVVGSAKPSLYAQFVFARERPNGPRSPVNSWPDLPGFRDTALAYAAEIEALGRMFLPLWSAALKLPRDYFEPYFKTPHLQTGLLHYPPQKEIGNRQYGISPHTDNALMTFLAQANVPGLAVRMPSGHWRIVDIVPGTLVVNTGNSLVWWTNEEFLSTKHRVINTNTVDRYSIPVFFGPSDDTVIAPLPTCQGPTRPPLYEPTTYGDLRSWYFGGRKRP